VPNTGAGQYSYYDRGAQETGDAFTIGASAAFSATTLVGTPTDVSVPVSDDWAGQTIVDCTFNFDDGTVLVSQPPVDGACTAQHTYSSLGVYYWNLTVTASDGVTKPLGGNDTVVASGILRPNLGLTALSSRTVQASATPTDSYGWSIVQCRFDFGDGTTSIVSAAGGRSCVGTHTYAAVGTFPVSMTVTDSQGETATETLDFGADGYYFDPTVPIRVLDTRKPIGVSSIAKVGPGGIVKLKLAGTNGIPADAGAVALNLTATNGTANGFVTVFPDGTTPPTSSNLNFAASQTVPNTVVVKLGDDGTVDLKNNSTGTTDLVADLDGYYAPSGAGYVPQSPSRLIDTRTTHQTIAPNGTLRVYLGTTGAPAAVLNVTATDPTSNGFITAYPDGQAMPNASNVNYGPHQTIANEVTVQAGGNGYVDFKNESSGSVDLIVDLSGLFESGSGSPFVPIAPERLLDTRTGLGVLNGVGAGALPAGGTGDLMLWNSPIPDAGVAAVENVTVTEPQKNGYVLAYPEFGGSRPIGSTLNFAPGQTVANSATVALGTLGAEALYNGSTGSTQLVVDLFGYYF
jgi:hypothetical protein